MADFYIAPTGDDDTGDGSESAPWFNLARAIRGSSDGDTIYLKTGVYTNQEIGTNNSQLWSRSRTILGLTSNPYDTILDFNGGEFAFIGIASTNSNILTVKNFVVRNAKSYSNWGLFHTYVGALVNLENFVIENFISASSSNGANAPGLTTACNNLLFNKVIIDKLKSNVAGNFGAIFNWSGGITSIVTSRINNCVIYINDDTPTGTQKIFSLTAVNPQPNSEVSFKNTIIYNSSGSLRMSPTSNTNLEITMTSCCLYNLDLDDSNNIPVVVNSIEEDPLFVDGDNSNFRLKSSSPCIGNGSL